MRLEKFLIICLAPGVFFSCSKASDAPKQPEIIISTIKPFLVRSGDTITVTGKNFISAQGTTTVSLNGKQGKITESSNEVLKFVTPAMAGSGNVSVKVGEAVKEGAIVLYEYKATVTTIAGNGSVGNSDGTGTQASFNRPWGIAANDDGDLFVADGYNRLIRKISAS